MTYQLRVRLGACGGLGLSCSAHTAEDELFKWRTRTHWLCMLLKHIIDWPTAVGRGW